jgi:hypothetical protein
MMLALDSYTLAKERISGSKTKLRKMKINDNTVNIAISRLESRNYVFSPELPPIDLLVHHVFVLTIQDIFLKNFTSQNLGITKSSIHNLGSK